MCNYCFLPCNTFFHAYLCKTPLFLMPEQSRKYDKRQLWPWLPCVQPATLWQEIQVHSSQNQQTQRQFLLYCQTLWSEQCCYLILFYLILLYVSNDNKEMISFSETSQTIWLTSEDFLFVCYQSIMYFIFSIFTI